MVAKQWVARQWDTRRSIPRQDLVATTIFQARRLADAITDTPVQNAGHNSTSIAEIDLTTQEITKPVRYVKYDDMGVRYSVPEAEVDAFTYATEAIQNAEWGSDERDALIDDFNARFGEFNVEHGEAE